MSGLFDIFISERVRAVRDSLRQAPDDWTPYYIGEHLYHLTHKSGVDIWTQNRPYGLQISGPGGCSIWGGVAFPGLGPSRWSLLFAILRWERSHPVKVKKVNLAAVLGVKQ